MPWSQIICEPAPNGGKDRGALARVVFPGGMAAGRCSSQGRQVARGPPGSSRRRRESERAALRPAGRRGRDPGRTYERGRAVWACLGRDETRMLPHGVGSVYVAVWKRVFF